MRPTLDRIQNRDLLDAILKVTGGAAATIIAAIAVPFNCRTTARGHIRATAGVLTAFAAVADAGLDTLTATAHGLITGQTVYVTGSAQPGGVTATTLYYVRVIDANTIKLYATQANATANTSPIDITSVGAGVIVQSAPLIASYFVDLVARNINGNLLLTGAGNKVALEDVSAWDVTFVADTTSGNLQIKGLADPVLDTTFYTELEVRHHSTL